LSETSLFHCVYDNITPASLMEMTLWKLKENAEIRIEPDRSEAFPAADGTTRKEAAG